MNLVIIRENKNSTDSNGNDLLRFALSSEIVGNVFLGGLCTNLCLNGDANVVVAVPKNLSIEINTDIPKFISYTGKVPFGSELIRKSKRNQWLIVSNGRFATQIDSEMLHKTLADIHADIVAVNVEPGLLGGREKIRLTAQGKVAGFTRLYSDLAEPAPVPTDWPHHIFIKTDVLDRLVPDGNLPHS